MFEVAEEASNMIKTLLEKQQEPLSIRVLLQAG